MGVVANPKQVLPVLQQVLPNLSDTANVTNVSNKLRHSCIGTCGFTGHSLSSRFCLAGKTEFQPQTHGLQ
jgi:hypothetical protein